jgi:GT2 family glycosyltransferase
MTPRVSIVTPTYNRRDSLLRTLESLRRQTYPSNRFEIIVVDDGSDDGTQEACSSLDDLPLTYVRQSHLGGTAAKNRGARESTGELLVFLDDDITVNAWFLKCLVKQHQEKAKAIVMGVLHDVAPDAARKQPEADATMEGCDCAEVHFTECLGGFFSIRRADFMALGMLEDPAPGYWPNWEDVDLAYRAESSGFTFYQCKQAIGYHWDQVLSSLSTQCRRWEHAARSAVFLFQKHPALRTEIPMFRDKGPIEWRQDSPALVLRKVLRQIASSDPVMWLMKQPIPVLEHRASDSTALRLLYRWIVSGHIYQGYRAGLREATWSESRLS